METQDKIKVVEKYVEAFAKQDMAIIREIYASDATVEDPVGTPVHEGIEAICAFYEKPIGSGVTLVLKGPPGCAGNAVAFSFEVTLPGMSIDVIDVFEFNADGKVASMKAYWGKENIRS